MAYWKLVLVAVKARRGWKRIPPDQRRKLMASAGKQVRKHGPTVAKQVRKHGPSVARQVGTAVRAARKRR